MPMIVEPAPELKDRPKVSVVIPARNEYPQILSTILCVTEELEAHGYPYEFVVVSNQSDDGTPDVLEDRFRHWVREDRLKVVRFDERPACWHARNVGVENAIGDVLIIMDGHMSIAHGTLDTLIRYQQTHGGLWHSASQMWGDPRGVRLYGYRLQIEEKFWGALSRHIPREVFVGPCETPVPYTVPMAQYSLFVLSREEFLEVRGFHPSFRCYGGGEPYMALKWWLLGKRCWLHPGTLVRHAFGLNHRWRKIGSSEQVRGSPFVRGKGVVPPEAGDEVLHYGRDYAWNNDQLWYNFLLAAYTIGGRKWLQQRYLRYHDQCRGVERYIETLNRLRDEAERDGGEDRRWVEAHQVVDLDELLAVEPWNDFSVEGGERSVLGCEKSAM